MDKKTSKVAATAVLLTQLTVGAALPVSNAYAKGSQTPITYAQMQGKEYKHSIADIKEVIQKVSDDRGINAAPYLNKLIGGKENAKYELTLKDYKGENHLGLVQFSSKTLENLGYIKHHGTNLKNNWELIDKLHLWTGKRGVSSLKDFLSPEGQVNAAIDLLEANQKVIDNNHLVDKYDYSNAELHVVMHFMGASKTIAFLKGETPPDLMDVAAEKATQAIKETWSGVKSFFGVEEEPKKAEKSLTPKQLKWERDKADARSRLKDFKNIPDPLEKSNFITKAFSYAKDFFSSDDDHSAKQSIAKTHAKKHHAPKPHLKHNAPYAKPPTTEKVDSGIPWGALGNSFKLLGKASLLSLGDLADSAIKYSQEHKLSEKAAAGAKELSDSAKKLYDDNHKEIENKVKSKANEVRSTVGNLLKDLGDTISPKVNSNATSYVDKLQSEKAPAQHRTK